MWYGRRKHNWIYATFCDYGQAGRKTILCRHYSEGATVRYWKRIVLWYGPRSPYRQHQCYRVWQEDRSRKVINDSGAYGHKDFANVREAEDVQLYAYQ